MQRPDGGCTCADSAEGMNAKSQKVYDMVKRMKQEGVPIDGVGLQMHISLGGAPPVKDIAANMARCAAPAQPVLGCCGSVLPVQPTTPTSPHRWCRQQDHLVPPRQVPATGSSSRGSGP